ncbi:GNAT family N-acetyltransferase [Salipaludibacillus aurantiacus]|uniref:Predicted N-acyltransferase, GNAT family n=1 Tax=Salipaludibacillus aurantiacus TaxID=1601833 RepID=A0A1H9WZ54_9BACI|nr:GNAT family N-acetyltransferase [Salipaludibacillus aurantiacus]SES39238.1 Predicted N-acyltransferase, GNAT family [Salipaludibacillus aurantiacus]
MVEVRKAIEENELKDVYKVRREVFILEQGVPEEIEIDNKEKEAIHFIVYREGTPVGAGRLRIEGTTAKAERVCILKEVRRKGLGSLLMNEMEETAKAEGLTKFRLNAQVHAEPFYLETGYKTISDQFYDADILHVTMEKNL